MVLDGLPGLYGFKYDSATACGLPSYLYSYKLVGSTTGGGDRHRINLHRPEELSDSVSVDDP